jgi:S-formylglutathione hydrolase
MTARSFTTRSEQRAFDGVQGFYEHESAVCAGPMRFSVYLPPAAVRGARVPVLYYLAGLTCTEETFVIKAGAQRVAAALDLMLVTCDTSPRAARFPGDDADWDFGQGAGFYLDATQAPWSSAYRMRSSVTRELRELVEREFPVRDGARGIFGHSMGGHGALSIALAHPGEYRSVSAFAPIVAPSQVPWGIKAFTGYLGDDRRAWAAYDTLKLLETRTFDGTLLVDQGTDDKFLERELRPELLEQACERSGQSLKLRRRTGYDHSYYFIASFIEDHLRHHAGVLDQAGPTGGSGGGKSTHP